MKATTKQKWVERVSAWRASGQEASAFAAGKGYEASTLRWWASRLDREEAPRIVRLVPRRATRDVESDQKVSPPGEVVVEVGGARVRVTSGFDGVLLAEVVRALSLGGAR